MGLGFRVWGVGFGVLGFGVWGLGSRSLDLPISLRRYLKVNPDPHDDLLGMFLKFRDTVRSKFPALFFCWGGGGGRGGEGGLRALWV